MAGRSHEYRPERADLPGDIGSLYTVDRKLVDCFVTGSEQLAEEQAQAGQSVEPTIQEISERVASLLPESYRATPATIQQRVGQVYANQTVRPLRETDWVSDGTEVTNSIDVEDQRQVLSRAISAVLDDRQATVIRAHFGLDGSERTLAQIGGLVGGISAKRVSQIEGQALYALRTSPKASELQDYAADTYGAVGSPYVWYESAVHLLNPKPSRLLLQQLSRHATENTQYLTSQTVPGWSDGSIEGKTAYYSARLRSIEQDSYEATYLRVALHDDTIDQLHTPNQAQARYLLVGLLDQERRQQVAVARSDAYRLGRRQAGLKALELEMTVAQLRQAALPHAGSQPVVR